MLMVRKKVRGNLGAEMAVGVEITHSSDLISVHLGKK